MSNTEYRILAVLGPTNTGKTHFAMERLLAHKSGIIGFPLRLLARENYERALKIKGREKVALITGEEKIIPKEAKYFLCTVEAMPLDKVVHFLAVDEIQMCADAERGHIFTARLLHARGTDETLFLGASTIKPLIQKLFPKAYFIQRPRLSTLSYIGHHKINRLPTKSAIVAFSATDVYEIAEQVRRHRGGAAVVMGSLSPRTRNAQVEMYQEGKVSHIVATDAIGMGLNMDLDHVSFAATKKFDGRQHRSLNEPELAQIAGRAGRFMNDGSFGVTGRAFNLPLEATERIEQHRFKPIKFIYWRNPYPELSSVKYLKESLFQPPQISGLIRSSNADDELALEILTSNKEVLNLASTPEGVSLLWEVCQIPDFRKVMSDAHARLLGKIYVHLMDTSKTGRLPTDWIAKNLQRLDSVDGNIEFLTDRLANIRTWTYIAHHSEWLDNACYWQEKTKNVEDKLSDALHARLTQRFVDQRTTLLVKHLHNHHNLLAFVKKDGAVFVEGQVVGILKGFCFTAASTSKKSTTERSIQQATKRALEPEIKNRLRVLEMAHHNQITLDNEGYFEFKDSRIARLYQSREILSPIAKPLPSDLLNSKYYGRIQTRLNTWFLKHIREKLKLLITAKETKLSNAARGLIYQLSENLGSLTRKMAKSQIDALTKTDRNQLKKMGVQIGSIRIYFPSLLKPEPAKILGLLWAIRNKNIKFNATLQHGRVSLPSNQFPKGYLEASGYHTTGRLAIRFDILERIAQYSWKRIRKGSFVTDSHLLSLAGCKNEDLTEILNELGFSISLNASSGNGLTVKKRVLKFDKQKKFKNSNETKIDPNSPFAILKEISIR